MQRSHRIVRKHKANPSARSLLTLAVSDALASCRQTAAAPRRRDTQAILAMATAMTFAFAGLPAHAQQATSNWTGEVSGSWFNPDNWSDGVPGEFTDAVINTTSPHPTLFDGNDPSGSYATVLNVYVGRGGAGELTIANGGSLASANLNIGLEGGEGTVTVTGAGSNWSYSHPAGRVIVGFSGNGTLLVEAGGTVSTLFGYVGYLADSVGEGTVTGADSKWLIRHSLFVGDQGAGMLEILDGGLVGSQYGVIGDRVDSTGAVRVEGADSRWEMDDQLIVGHLGTGTLVIRGGGAVSNARKASFIGNLAGSTGEVRVDGAGSTWKNSAGLYVGNGGSGTLEVLDGGHVESTTGYIGSVNGSDGKVRVSGVDSAGTRSNWEIGAGGNDGYLVVGGAGTGSLLVEAGGTVSSGLGYIGNEEGSVGKATVTGSGSTWINLGTLAVGKEGQGLLQILDGGLVESASGSINSGTAPDGGVEVIGSDSTWVNAGGLLVGETSLGSMEVLDGGLVESASVSLGSGTGSEGQVRVNGFDAGGVSSRLGITGNLLVGDAGTGKLLVDNAGVLDNQDGIIGNSADSTDSRALVTGTGSTWTNRGVLSVGNGGQGILEVLDGGHVESASGSIGSQAGADGKVRVSGIDSAGTRSSWEIDAGNLTVGDAGTGLLLVDAGGRVRNQHGFIGNEEGSAGKVTVTGEGSAWINDHGLWVGNAGSGELEILEGGVVGSMEAVVANVGGGTVLVDGEGSRWDIGGTFAVGNFGLGQVTVRNGGVLTSMYGVIGSQGQARSTVLVQGAGSSWTGLEALYIGLEGNAALTIADGGRVEVSAGMFGSGVVLGEYGGSSGILNIGTGGAAGLLDAASITGGAGSATLNFNHDEADYAFTNDGTAGGTAVLIGGSTTVNQIGSGTTVLTGANTYTGATNVNAGTLLVEGSLGDTVTTVADGATLGGSGSIAGDVTIADGGVLAPGSSAGTLTVGSLSLSSGSTLDYELGQAGAIGGGVNDLIEVTGNLTLDGTLDITDIGGFGAGVYRLINYGGDLIDNGLEIGARPVDADANDLSVLTTYDGQVNLASTAGLTLGFWDGAMSPDNSAIDGGDGSWNADNSSWTTADGDMNGRWDDGTFAVFGGTAGNVEVVGEQNVAGLQFMSGYMLAAGTDGALRIDNAESVIRVDPDVTATIAAPIIGAGGLVKTDTGTLVLLGENSYAGGTRIDLGTLQVASDANLGDANGGLAFDGGTLQTTAVFDSARNVDLQADGGTFLTDASLGLSGAITGAGALTKDGAGTLTLTGANAYTGGTRVLEGTLVGDAGSIRGNLDNDGNVVFDQADDGTFAGAIAGDGTLAKRGAGALTLTGNSALDWSIDAGALVATAGFIGDASIADGARLRLEQVGDTTYAGVLSGAGGFESGGSGTLVLTSDSSAFAGSTGVDAGTLQVDGALGGSVEVGIGAALAGDGMLGGAVRILDGGRLAPGAGVGTLTMGTLWLSEGATLDYELGQAGAIGGDANDLLEVAGDLTLDGTLDITDIGGFGAGVYRLINYGGVLTDNTLDLGALPDGFEADDLFLQTAVDGQVNLVNSAGVVLGFWDGGAGPADDGDIQGGDGTWTGSDRSWTDANGAINGDWGAGFAVFGGEAGTVTVEGTQAFTGLQFMTDGYRITGDALAMDTAETIVRVDRDVTATIESSLTGSGALVKHDAGTLVLSGENSYAGGTQLLGGVLAVGADANLGAADGALAFDGGALRMDGAFDSARDISVGDKGGAFDSGTFDTTLAGDFSGNGTFTRIGSGTLTLVGASHGFTGTFALQSGGLRVDGNLGGTLAIANGALLTGIGTLHDIDNHGTVAAGHSIGTLTLTGDYIHHDDATLLAEIEPGGASDLLDVAGSATLEGGAVQVVKLPGQYEGGTRYTLIDAAGGVTGTFDTLDQDLPFLDLLLGYDANHVYLDVQRNEVDFDIVCGDGTFNQCQVAGALDAIGHDHPIPDDLETVLTEVTSLTLDQTRAGFDTLSGEAHGSLAGLLLEGHAMYGQAVSRRIAERRGQAGADRLHGGAWVRAYGNSSDLDGDGNAHAADFEQRGLAVGFDAWGGEQWLVGASFNAMNIDADFRPGDRGEADARNASLYATFEGEHAYLDVVTSFAWWDNEITRAIVVGDIDRYARSTYGGHQFATHLEAGWNFALGERQQLTPLVSVEYAKLDQEGFREEGADDLDLIGRSQDVERTTVTAGLRWSTAFERGDWTFEPTLQARWLHALGDEHAEQAVAFAGAPDIGYRVRGVSWPQDRGLVGVGLQLRHGDNLDLFVDVDYQKGGGLEAKNLGAGLRWRW